FQLNKNDLNSSYQQLQSQYHPDRFAHSSDQERRLAVQATTFINEAYEALSDQQSRARYLLELSGVQFDLEKDTTQDMNFLMMQMNLREAIDEVDKHDSPLEKLDELADDARLQKKQLVEEFQKQYQAQEWEQAKDTVLKLQFFNRLQQQINHRQEQLEEEIL
ncbi:MAG: Fe-S protein assembly co-chaperone HscB, partial [Pseudomonadota bacterium]